MLNTLDVTKYVAACANKVGISIVWEEKVSPRTDGNTIYLPYLEAGNVTNAIKLMQFVKHETSHVAYSDFSLLAKEKPEGLLMFIDNLLEDHRVDWLNDSEYAGDRSNTEAYMEVHANDTKDSTYTDDIKATIIPLFSWDLDVREDMWARTGDWVTHHMNEEGKAIKDKLHAGDYAEVLRNIRNIADKAEGSQACYDLAKRILKEVFDCDPQAFTSEGVRSGSEGDGGSEAADGDESGDSEGDVEASSEGGEEEGDKSRTDKLLTIDYKGAKIGPYSEHKPEGEGVNATNYTCGDSYSYTPTPYNDVLVHNFVTGTGTLDVGTGEGYTRGSDILKHTKNSQSMSNAIRTKLQIISRDRWEYGKKKGKLNNSSLYRVGMKDAKGLNERLFKQQIHNETLDVCVQVLVDASGSMCGSKYENASSAACILNDVLSNTLNIPLEILAFTELSPSEVEQHTIFIMKEFDKKCATPTMATNFSRASNYLADNVDGESLEYGYVRIRGRKEKRKLMVILSDGSPCGGRSKGSTIRHTRKVIKAIESSPVELVAVGIEYDGVKDYYHHFVAIDAAKNIESALLSLISNHIIRSV